MIGTGNIFTFQSSSSFQDAFKTQQTYESDSKEMKGVFGYNQVFPYKWHESKFPRVPTRASPAKSHRMRQNNRQKTQNYNINERETKDTIKRMEMTTKSCNYLETLEKQKRDGEQPQRGVKTTKEM